MSEYKFSNNDKVTFINGDVSGYGEVVGVATTDMAVIGPIYMIKVLFTESPAVMAWQYDTIAVPEINMVGIHVASAMHGVSGDKSIGGYPIYIKQPAPEATGFIEDTTRPVLTIPYRVLHGLRDMPDSERGMFGETWVDFLYVDQITALISKPHFRLFMLSLLTNDGRKRSL